MCPQTQKCPKQEGFYGTTTMGERGQIVIPAQAREDFNLEKGEKLLVFGMGKNMIALVKLAQVKEFARRLSRRLGSIEAVLRKIT